MKFQPNQMNCNRINCSVPNQPTNHTQLLKSSRANYRIETVVAIEKRIKNYNHTKDLFQKIILENKEKQN